MFLKSGLGPAQVHAGGFGQMFFVSGLKNCHLMKDPAQVHAGLWDVDVRSRKCEAVGCARQPSFGPPSDTTPRYSRRENLPEIGSRQGHNLAVTVLHMRIWP